MRDKFIFFENFKTVADKLPDDMRLKFYDAMLDYVFNDVEPTDAIISALVNAIKPSLDREDGRTNNGGKREGAGRPKSKEIKDDEIEKNEKDEINSNQSFSNLINSNQLKSIPLEIRNKKQEIINISSDKSSDMFVGSDEKFETFWREYIPIKCEGRIVGKGSKEEAKNKFLKIIKSGETYENIINGLRKYLHFCQQNNQLTCSVSVFLNQKRWLDDYDCSGVSAEQGRGQRQKSHSMLEPYAELIAEYRNKEQVYS